MIEALGRDGWGPLFVVDPALVIVERVMPMARVIVTHAERGHWASVELIADSAVDEVFGLFPTGPTEVLAPLSGAPWTLRVRARNVRAARAAADRLGEVTRGPGSTLEGWARALAAIGWTVTEQTETWIEEPSWKIRGEHDGEELDVGLHLATRSLNDGEGLRVTVGNSDVSFLTDSLFGLVQVHSRPIAAALVASLS